MICVVAILKPKVVLAQLSVYFRTAKMNVVVLNVKGSLYDFAGAILLSFRKNGPLWVDFVAKVG